MKAWWRLDGCGSERLCRFPPTREVIGAEFQILNPEVEYRTRCYRERGACPGSNETSKGVVCEQHSTLFGRVNETNHRVL